MAESVARVKILAQVEGLEGFDKLKGAFKGLQQAIGPADSELDKARKQILEFGKAGAQTEQVLKGQVEALKALQTQATIGGTVYRRLSQDVKALGSAYKEAATGAKQLSDAQIASQFVASKPDKFSQQIAALQRQLRGFSVYADEYTQKLTEIQRRQLSFNTAVGRQNVIANAAAFAQGGKNAGQALPELPNTTAGLQQRYAELAQQLQNATRYGDDWIRSANEMARIQRELNREGTREQEVLQRNLELRQRVQRRMAEQAAMYAAPGSGTYRRDDGVMIAGASPSAAPSYRDASGTMIAGPAAQARRQLEQPMRQITELYQSIGNVGMSRIAGDIDRMGKSYEEVARDIRAATAASDGSINSLRAQRQSWEALRNTLGTNKAALREVSREIDKVDRQLEKRGLGGNRGGAAQIGQGLGALAASGIFGGPEGFLGSAGGAAIGAIMGGPAGLATGAFIGGSVGAYGGMARQALGGMSTYAADISKQEIALKGITKTQEEYNRALAASAAVTRDFNVPQLEATRGITQLSAAVIGAGGKVADAEVVFRNVTAAIKASGGSAEDVQGAMTALSQIFSKGKVSAEELQGQLGERLPGAVTMFAQATGRTLPQLQKDLEQGVVGLADLMKFVVSDQGLGQFEQRAKAVADSSADAGARLTVTWNDTRRAIGDALLPLGAELQGALAEFLTGAGPALVGIAEGFVAVARATGGALQAFQDFTAPVRDFFASSIFAYLRTASAFWDSLRNDLESFWGRVGDFLSSVGSAFTGFFENLRDIGGRALRAIGIDTEWLSETTGNVVSQLKKAWDSLFEFVRGRWRQTVANMVNNTNPLFFILKQAGVVDVGNAVANGLAAGGTSPQGQVVAGGKTNRPPSPGQLTDWKLPEQQQKSAKDKADRDAKAIEDNRQRLAEQTAQAQKQLADALFRYQQDLDRKRYDLQVELTNQLRQNYVDSLVGPGKAVASEFGQLMRDLEQFNRRQADIAQQIAAARQEIATSRSVASVVGQGASTAAAGGGLAFSATQLQAAANQAARFTGIANMCSESVKAFYKSLGISLPGVTAWADTVRNAGQVMRDWSKLRPGDIVATGRPGDTPHVGVYTGGNNVFHQSRSRGLRAGNYPDLDYFRQGGYFVRPSASVTGGGKGAVREVKAVNDVAMEEAKLNALLREQAQLQQQAGALIRARVEGYQINRIAPIQEETRQIIEQNAALADRGRLELEGVRPELIDAEVRKGALRRKELEERKQLNMDLAEAEKLTDPTVAEGVRQTIANQTAAYQEQRAAIEALTAAQIALNDAMRFRQDMRIGEGLREGAQSYVESIGTMREASAQLAQNGIKGIEDAIFNLVTTGKTNFREFAADILRQTARMIIQQMILRTIMQAIGGFGGGGGLFANGGVFGGGISFNPAAYSMPSLMAANGNAFAKNNIIPFAQGGIVDSPTLFKFAKGGAMATGVMGEAGPEAIMPLRRGRDGKLGVSGGSNTVVTVNVDASGSKVQGDSGRGEQLGRAVSQAVQEELLRQKRPGGLLAA